MHKRFFYCFSFGCILRSAKPIRNAGDHINPMDASILIPIAAGSVADRMRGNQHRANAERSLRFDLVEVPHLCLST